MSECIQVRLVCEGDTDYLVLEAVLEAVLAPTTDYELVMIQPERDTFDPAQYAEGSGWKGVRAWMQRRAPLDDYLTAGPLSSADMLVIHVDADVAGECEVACEKPCPPARDTVLALQEVLLKWAGTESVPPRTVIWIPSKATETWVLAALHPGHRWRGDPECQPAPDAALAGKSKHPVAGKLVRGRSGGSTRTYQKSTEAYRAAQPALTSAWPSVLDLCPQARRFQDDLLAAVGALRAGA